MSWVTVIWLMLVSACLTLAGMYFLVWCRSPRAWAHLLFAVSAVGTAGLGMTELLLMRAGTPEQQALFFRWGHIPAWVMFLGLMGFVRLYMRAGRIWLMWAACGLRTVHLLLNFLVGQNSVYLEQGPVRHIQLLGETVAVAGGVPNILGALLGLGSLVLLIGYALDATVTVWRRGDRRMALSVGGGIVFVSTIGLLQTALLNCEPVHAPLAISLFFVGLLFAMGQEMSRGTSRAAQLAEELAENQAQMSMAAEAAGVGVWVWNITLNQVRGSKEWMALIGAGPDAPGTIEEVFRHVHPDDRETVELAIRRAAASQGEYRVDYRVVLPDGSHRWMASRGAMRPASNGTPARMLSATIDITGRKHAELAMAASEQRFQLVAEFSGAFVWEMDANGVYTYASPSVEKLLGYTPDELIGKKHFTDLFAPSVREELKAAAFRVFAERRLFRDVPYPSVSKNGRVLYLETSGAPILDAGGNLIGYRGADTDVTARTISQAEIADQRNELAHLSRVTMLGELAGSLAHELNQPLAAILSNAQAAQRFLAHDGADLGEVREILRDIAVDDQRAGEIIRRLRLLLRKGEVQRGPLDMNDVVQDVLRLVRNDLMNHGVWLRTEFANDLPVVAGDRVQLQQVLLNLIMNAVDAMAQVSPGEKKQLFVSTQRPAEEEVRVAVTDHGIGLSTDVREKIFSPYFTTKTSGMGMGLKVCRTIIDAHGGQLAGRNNEQGGATFEFTLPAAREVLA